jgi:hypothetical protein
MAVQNPAGAPALDTDSSKNVPWYIGDDDLPDLDESVRKIFAQYTHLPAEKVRSHVLDVVGFSFSILRLVPCVMYSEISWQISIYHCLHALKLWNERTNV